MTHRERERERERERRACLALWCRFAGIDQPNKEHTHYLSTEVLMGRRRFSTRCGSSFPIRLITDVHSAFTRFVATSSPVVLPERRAGGRPILFKLYLHGLLHKTARNSVARGLCLLYNSGVLTLQHRNSPESSTSLFPSSSVALSSSEYCLASADKATFRSKSRCAAALDNSVSSTRIW